MTADLILGKVYMGSQPGADELPHYGAVLNLQFEHQDLFPAPTSQPIRPNAYLWMPISDGAPAPSLDWLRAAVNFVRRNAESQGQETLIHCGAGISRSGLVTVAWVMTSQHIGVDEALAFVRAKRPGCSPNPYFLGLLGAYEAYLAGSEWKVLAAMSELQQGEGRPN